MIVQELEQSLNEQAPPSQPDTSGLHELPPLNIDGIPTPVDKMTQVIHLIFINITFNVNYKITNFVSITNLISFTVYTRL